MNNKYLFYSFFAHLLLLFTLFFWKINNLIEPKEMIIEIISGYSYNKNSSDYDVPNHLTIPSSQLTEKSYETGKSYDSEIEEAFLRSDLNTDFQPKIAYNLPKNLPVENIEKFNNIVKESNKENSTYFLEGEIKNRKIVKEVLPTYPKEIQVNTKVKIKFVVLPNGELENMIVIEKSYLEIEKATLNALKLWQFSSISKNENQQGIITFNFELE